MRFGGLAALVAAALLALPATALALAEYGPADVVADSLFVTGDTVTYADREGRDTDGFAVVREGDHFRGVLDRLPDPPGRNRFHQYEEFGASDQRHAFGFAEYTFGGLDDEPSRFGFHSGAGQEGEGVLSCDGDPGLPQVAVAGNAVAHQPAACSGRDLAVRDFTPGGPTRIVPLTESVAELRMAGRYVAYALHPRNAEATSPETQIVVYDWVAGTEAYRARASEAVPQYGGHLFAAFDIQADGKLVFVSARNEAPIEGPDTCADRYSIVWYSTAEPAPHVLPVKACVPDYRIDGDRIAFFRSDGTSTGARLVVSDLSGGSVANVARFKHYRLGQHFDVGGDRAVFTTRTCLEHRLFRESLPPSGETFFKLPTCPIRIHSSAGKISAGGIASVRYTCPQGCNLYSRVQKPFSSDIKPARIRAGRSGVIRFRVPASTRARLQRQGAITMRVFAGIDDSVPVTKRNFAADVKLRAR